MSDKPNATMTNQDRFNSAVMDWIREATQAIKSCAVMCHSAERNVGKMYCQCVDAYKDLVQQQTVSHHHSLTDAEREAIERAAFALNGGEDWSPDVCAKDKQACVTLRSLLERTKCRG